MQDILLRNELVIGGNKELFKGSLELKYTDDVRDNMAISASLLNESPKGINYKANLALTHPKTLLNVNVNAHLTSTPRLLSAGVDAMYLTTRRVRSNAAAKFTYDKKDKDARLQVCYYSNNQFTYYRCNTIL